MIAALTGMGKSSLFWAILYDLLRQFGPACIRLVVIDPKRVEWSVAEKHAQESPIVQAYAGSPMQWGDNGIRKGGDGWLQVNVEQLIEDRLVEYASNGYRDHTPTPDSPIIFVLVDETLPLASSLRKLKENHPLAKAAFMGRAIGVYLLFATQAAEKDVLGLIRDLINNRACGRMLSKDQVDMAMGDDSVKHGANAHLLHPVEDRGVFYFRDEAARIFAGRVGYAEDADTVDLIMGRIPVRRPPKPPRDLYAPRDTYVYHLYNRQGERIYIGKSVNPAKRLEQHCDGEHEWSDEIDPAGMVVDSLWDSEAAALVEERRQIERATRNGELLYNVAHNKGRVRVPVGAAVAVDPWELEG
jgi:predicted GIY-YIG superfamily endonuclease